MFKAFIIPRYIAFVPINIAPFRFPSSPSLAIKSVSKYNIMFIIFCRMFMRKRSYSHNVFIVFIIIQGFIHKFQKINISFYIVFESDKKFMFFKNRINGFYSRIFYSKIFIRFEYINILKPSLTLLIYSLTSLTAFSSSFLLAASEKYINLFRLPKYYFLKIL